MKKIVFINRTDKGSTGNIVSRLFESASKYDFEAYFIGFSLENGERKIPVNSGSLNTQINRFTTKIDGKDGFKNVSNTKRILKIIDSIRPDIVNIHNVLGYFLNFPLLINGLKNRNIKIVVTCHDCWWFTGKCPHFEFVNCFKWKTACEKCPQLKQYPKSFLCDKTNKMFFQKKSLFSNNSITFVSPSEWLSGYMKESFLKNEDILVINNGIDISKFSPVEKENHSKIRLLFAANPWTEKKGLDTLDYLLKNLPSDKYEFLIAGPLKNNQFKNKNISFLGTVAGDKMPEVFKEADYFINPTLEDNFPTIDIESIASKTPVISYDTGGSKEIIGTSGILVEKNEKEKMLDVIENINDYQIKMESAERFDYHKMVDSYYRLFKEKLEEE